MIFQRQKKDATVVNPRSAWSEIALDAIGEGVMITDKNGVIQFMNVAAATMLNLSTAADAVGLDYGLFIKLESKNGQPFEGGDNKVVSAMVTGQPLEDFQCYLVAQKVDKRTPIAISVLPNENGHGERIITFRNIAKDLEEEGAQTEFISTASHEMRTPVASIEGFLSLALNPQTATIDDRARQYLTQAHDASKHLGNLFKDLLDVTKIDDGRIQPRFMPVELVETVKKISDTYAVRAGEANLKYQFGGVNSDAVNAKLVQPVVYGYIDMSFLQEIMANLIDNAIKYTPAGGSIYVNVLGDGDRALINVTDTGIGISADDLQHIFQKFYRADNSQTRTVGGTGLGLYLVKQRVESMNGRIWAESAFGEGTTFYVSLPRLSADEYSKRLIDFENQEAAERYKEQMANPLRAQMAQQQPASQPAPVSQPQQPVAQPAPQPQPAPALQPQPALAPQPAPAPQPVIQQNETNNNGGTVNE